MTCCDWDHVRPCGPMYVDKDILIPEICACGCGADDSRCGTIYSYSPLDKGLDD